MRLFIAINFSDEIKKELLRGVRELREKSISGNFTRENNLHLTLAFIGETDRSSDIENIMREFEFRPFPLTIGGCGVFKRFGGDIFWAGVRENPQLSAVVRRLSAALIDAGFDIDDRKFTPHITLGREVVTQSKVRIIIPDITMTADRISLMKSERINGKLTYTEIYASSCE